MGVSWATATVDGSHSSGKCQLFAESDNYQEVYVRDDDSVGMFLTIRVEEQYTPPATENPTLCG